MDLNPHPQDRVTLVPRVHHFRHGHKHSRCPCACTQQCTCATLVQTAVILFLVFTACLLWSLFVQTSDLLYRGQLAANRTNLILNTTAPLVVQLHAEVAPALNRTLVLVNDTISLVNATLGDPRIREASWSNTTLEAAAIVQLVHSALVEAQPFLDRVLQPGLVDDIDKFIVDTDTVVQRLNNAATLLAAAGAVTGADPGSS